MQSGARAFSPSLRAHSSVPFPGAKRREQPPSTALATASRSLVLTGTRGLRSFLQKSVVPSPRPWFKLTSRLIWTPASGTRSPGPRDLLPLARLLHCPCPGCATSPQKGYPRGDTSAPRCGGDLPVRVPFCPEAHGGHRGRQLQAPDSPQEVTYVGKLKSCCSKCIHKL